MFGRLFTPSVHPSLLMFHIDCSIAQRSLVLYGPLQRFFHFGEEIVITCTDIGWVQWMFQNLPLSAEQEVCDDSWGVTPSTVTKNDGVPYHQMSSFSPEHITKVELQERAIVSSIYCLLWRYSVMQYYLINVIHHNKHHLHSTLCRAHFLCTRRTGMLPFISLRFKFGSYERAQVS